MSNSKTAIKKRGAIDDIATLDFVRLDIADIRQIPQPGE